MYNITVLNVSVFFIHLSGDMTLSYQGNYLKTTKKEKRLTIAYHLKINKSIP